MVSHVSGFLEKWAGRFMDSVDMTRFVVYGDPSPEARALLEGFGPKYLDPWGGFSRFAESWRARRLHVRMARAASAPSAARYAPTRHNAIDAPPAVPA
jgi:hypothetical protein